MDSQIVGSPYKDPENGTPSIVNPHLRISGTPERKRERVYKVLRP